MHRSEEVRTGIVRAWLDEGSTQLSPRVHDAVLREFPGIPQDGASGPRLMRLTTYAAAAVAVAAVAAMIVVGGLDLSPRPGGDQPGGGPSPADGLHWPMTPPSAAASTQVIDDLGPFEITIDLPEGWQQVATRPWVWAASTGPDALIGFSVVSQIPTEVPSAGQDREPVDVSGFSGVRILYDPESLARGVPGVWAVLGAGVLPEPGFQCLPGECPNPRWQHLWLVDVGDVRLAMVALTGSPRELNDLRKLVESVRIERP